MGFKVLFFVGGVSYISGTYGSAPIPTTVADYTTGRTSAPIIHTTTTLPEGFYSTGKCPDHSLCNARTSEECTSLAATTGLGLVSKSFYRTDRVAGCFITPDETLKFNTFADSIEDAGNMIILCIECPSTTSAPSTVSQATYSTPALTTDTSTPYQTTTDEYRLVESGLCSDSPGYCTIEDSDLCETAAGVLGVDSTLSGNPINRLDRAPGCWLTRAGNLKINEAFDSITPANGQTNVCVLCPSTQASTSEPTSKSTTPLPYAFNMGGLCSDLGEFCHIESVEECELAAADLGFSDTEVNSFIDLDTRPPGCWLTSAGNLKMNSAFDSTSPASATQTNLCVSCDPPPVLTTEPVTEPPSTTEVVTVTEPPSTTEDPIVYASNAGGLCSDLGEFCHIESVEECELAAADLGFSDTQVNSFIDLDTRPPGCWLTSAGNLKMNSAFDSTSPASAAQTNLCVSCDPPPVLTTEDVPLYAQYTGSCSDHGSFCPIESVEECELAAAELGLSDTEVNSFIDLDTRPPGCWLTGAGNLKMNNAFESTALTTGGQTVICEVCIIVR